MQQLYNTQEGENYRKQLVNLTSDFISGDGTLAKTPTGLRAGKRTLQELLGSGRWYGTLTKENMIVWIILTTTHEETAIEEMTQEKAKERKRKKRKEKEKEKKEQKRKGNNAELRRRT